MIKRAVKMHESEAMQQLVRERPISSYIPYSHHVTDHIIATKSADYLSVWKIGGRSHQSASAEDLIAWVQDLNNLLRGLSTATSSISIWTHIVRRKVDEYPDHQYDNIFCDALNARYKESFNDYNLMVNDLYLTVMIRRASDNVLSFFSDYEKASLNEKLARQKTGIEELDEINHKIASSMRRYDPKLLGLYDHKGHCFSQPLEFLAYLINGEKKPMPVCRERFCDYMASNRVIFARHGALGEIRGCDTQKYFGMLDVKEYDDVTEPGHLNVLLESDFEFILTQSFSSIAKSDARTFLQRHRKRLVDSNDPATSQIAEIDEALNQLLSGHFVMGEHHCTLSVFGDAIDTVRRDMGVASAYFYDVGIVPHAVDLALEAGYWAQLPGNWHFRPRPSPITSLNFWCFSSFHNFLSGKPAGNPWGDAVTIFKTTSGTPLYFNFHSSTLDQDSLDQRLLGNTMLIGQSSSGKTVLLSFLMAQAQKLLPTIVAFDKDRGMEVTIRAMGGCYLPLKAGQPSGFNPFQLESTTQNLGFLKQLVEQLITAHGDVITHDDIEEIDKAVDALMSDGIAPHLRRLSMLLQFLPKPHRESGNSHPSVHERLLRWTGQGQYAWLFDNDYDALDLDTHTLYGFDLTEFLDDGHIRTPLTMYLLFRTEGMIDGRRFMYVFDEFWKPLQDEYFRDLAKNKQKTIRKQNGIFVFATQEPGDALGSDIAKTLIQQCATYIFLPNPKADRDDYIDGLKLSETEFSLVRSLGEDSRKFLIKQGDNSVVAELNLHGFTDELLVLSGTPDNAEVAESIIAEYGDDPEVWLPLYLQHVKGVEV